MYDLIQAWVDGSFAFPVGTVDVKSYEGRNGSCLTGTFRNLFLKQTPHCLGIRGSLGKFLHGENITPMTYDDVLNALDQLEQAFGIPLGNGRVTELEIGATLVMDRTPRWYLSTWGGVPRYALQKFGDCQTVLYRNGRKSFQGYEKSGEYFVGTASFPEEFLGKNLLRLEHKMKKCISRILGHQLTINGLRDVDTYLKLVKAWREFYFTIPKERKAFLNTSGTFRDLSLSLAAMGVIAIGGPENIINDIRERSDLSASERSKFISKVKSITQDPVFTITDELTEELDEKVRQHRAF